MRWWLVLVVATCVVITTRSRADEFPYHFTVATYDIMNFPKADDSLRAPAFQTVMAQIPADLLVIQKVKDMAAVDAFRQLCIPDMIAADWSLADKNEFMLFYNGEKFSLIETMVIPTDDRPLIMYHLAYNAFAQPPDVYVVTCRLKTGTTAVDKQIRVSQVGDLAALLEAEHPTDYVILAGDLYSNGSTDAHYDSLMHDSLFYDPVNCTGQWHDNAAAALYHSQSTRTEQFGGGASGGLDDRWDQILISKAFDFPEGWGWGYVNDSYQVFGNDGEHLNKAMNEPPNFLIEMNVAQALYDASDRLPVLLEVEYMERKWIEGVTVKPLPAASDLITAFPNPFNNSTTISYSVGNSGVGELALYNAAGRKIDVLRSGFFPAGAGTVPWNAADVTPGLYFVRMTTGSNSTVTKLILVK